MQEWYQSWASQAHRVLKPGGHLVAFGGTRTFHRLTCALEDAGFEIRDCLSWLYGSGFPKSLDVSKAIDKTRGNYADLCAVALWLRPHVERAGFGVVTAAFGFKDETMARARWTSRSQPQVPTWDQWGRLKALCGFGEEMDAEVWRLNGREKREVIGQATDGAGNGSMVGLGSPRSMATKYDITAPATETSRAWQGWGTALKPAWEPIILARKPLGERNVAANVLRHGTGAINVDGCRVAGDVPQVVQGAEDRIFGNGKGLRSEPMLSNPSPLGRWPANLVLDEAAAGMLDEQSGERPGATSNGRGHTGIFDFGTHETRPGFGDTGGASRFFYTAKADAEDRDSSTHPTVKPVELMKWLIRLVTAPGGVVLDPFLGSGTTVYAARALGIRSVGIEREAAYVEQAIWRLRQGVLL
jgi:hypothetical protein